MNNTHRKIVCALAALSIALGTCACAARPQKGETDPEEEAAEPPKNITALKPESSENIESGAQNGGEPEPSIPEPEPEPEPMTPEECAAALEALGILRGAGAAEDGTPDHALADTLTREEAVTLIARSMGYDHAGGDIDYPHPFEDVDEWAAGSVGFAYWAGIANGVSTAAFGSGRAVTWREMTIFLLRALGREDGSDDPAELAVSVGLAEELPADVDAPITRGDAAVMLVNFLTYSPDEKGISVLQRLVEAGLLTAEQVENAGFTADLEKVSEGTITADEALERLKGSVVLVSTRDIRLEELSSCHGSIVADGVVAVALEGIRGAMYITVTDSDGNTYECTNVLGYDTGDGIAYLQCAVTAADQPDLPEAAVSLAARAGIDPSDAAASPSSGVVYAVSDEVVAADAAHICSMPGLPVMDPAGNYLGVTSLRGVIAPDTASEGTTGLYDLCAAVTPELCPPVKPRGIDPTKPMTAVTYDDGPSASLTPQFLDLLEEYHVVATFFEVGYRLEAHPEFLQRMEDMGCEVANHTYDHKYFSKLSLEEVMDEVESTNDIIRSVLGHGAALVRCPGGITPQFVRDNVPYPLIYWTIDTRDWESRNAEKVIAHVTGDRNLDGDIILMHSIHEPTLEASRTIIPYIIEQGYQMVTVSELAYFRGVTLENGVTYVNFPKK